MHNYDVIEKYSPAFPSVMGGGYQERYNHGSTSPIIVSDNHYNQQLQINDYGADFRSTQWRLDPAGLYVGDLSYTHTSGSHPYAYFPDEAAYAAPRSPHSAYYTHDTDFAVTTPAVRILKNNTSYCSNNGQDLECNIQVTPLTPTTPLVLKTVCTITTPSTSSWCTAKNMLVFPDNRSADMTLGFELTMKMISFCVTCLLFWIITILGVGKMYIDGFQSYASFFTNWAWTLYGLYYGLIAFGHLFSCLVYRVSIFVLTLTVNGVSWSVLSIVFVIIYNNPEIVLGIMDGLGGDTPAGLVLVMNCVYHPVAVAFFLGFALLHASDISSVFYDTRCSLVIYPTWVSVIVGIWTVYSPIVMLLIYMCFYDPSVVYGYAVLNWDTSLIAFMICTVFNGGPYLLMSYRIPTVMPDFCEDCNGYHARHDFIQGLSWIFICMNVIRTNTSKHEDKINEKDIEHAITTNDGTKPGEGQSRGHSISDRTNNATFPKSGTTKPQAMALQRRNLK